MSVQKSLETYWRHHVYLRYDCICVLVHILCLCYDSMADAVSSGRWPILFKVLTLNVAICIVLLHFSNFCFSLSSIADFSNTGTRALTLDGRALFLPARRAMQFGQVVCVWIMVISRWLCFYSHLLINNSSSSIELFDPGHCPVGFVYPAPG